MNNNQVPLVATAQTIPGFVACDLSAPGLSGPWKSGRLSRGHGGMTKMLMLDLGAGLGGASEAMRRRGWNVVTVDINPEFNPDIVADLRTWSWDGPRPDLVWASPPCDEFAKFAMRCWYDVDALATPDVSLVLACKRVIDECHPRFWIIENVRGAIQFLEPILGTPRKFRPYYLWGHFPCLGDVKRHTWGTKTKKLSSTAKAERAEIPYSLSKAVALAIERQGELL
jgi:hypothetical protein